MIDIYPGFVILIFIYCVTGNGTAALIAYASAFIHELSHVIAARLFGYRLKKMSVIACGFCASFKNFTALPFTHEAAVALSGPAVNLILAFAASLLPFNYNLMLITAKINIYMLAINLLPIFPLDGGRLVYAFLKNEMKKIRAERIMHCISILVAAGVFILGAVCVFYRQENISLLIAALYIISNLQLKNGSTTDNDAVSPVKKMRIFSCGKNTCLSEVILRTGINRNILVFITEDEKICGYITGGDLKKAAFENRYGDSVMSSLKENTDGGIFNGN